MEIELEPTLEALTFCLESDLTVGDDNDQPEGQSYIPGPGVSVGIPKQKSLSLNPNLEIARLTQYVFNAHSQTPCPFFECPVTFSSINRKENHGDLLKHFLVVHNFVIDDVGQIGNLHRYLLHWKERFANTRLEEFCPTFLLDSSMTPEETLLNPDSSKIRIDEENNGKVKYFMLSDILPEDKQLRTKLWNERLETVVEVNRLEREQSDFSHQCLFCRDILTGNRRVLFNHMNKEHSFVIGQPDNLVFVHELMVHLTESLNKMNCIYCGKTFKDKAVMREHMRKKLHKKINPTNPDYDMFYIINYLEPGKDWKTLNEEEPEDERTEEEWVEKEECVSTVCLLCPFQSTKFDLLLSHMKSDHKFDFESLVENFDFYQKVKIVNFIRRNIHQTVCFYCKMKFLESGSLLCHFHNHREQKTEFPPAEVWNQPEYFFPTYENDQFLILLDHKNSMEEDGILETQDTNVIPEDMSYSQFSDA